MSSGVHTQRHHCVAEVRPSNSTYTGLYWLRGCGRRRWKPWTPRIKGRGAEGERGGGGEYISRKKKGTKPLSDWCRLHRWPVTDCLVGWVFTRKEKYLGGRYLLTLQLGPTARP